MTKMNIHKFVQKFVITEIESTYFLTTLDFNGDFNKCDPILIIQFISVIFLRPR